MTIDELIQQGDQLLRNAITDSFDSYVDYNSFDEWRRLSLMFLQQYYPNHPQTETFESLIGRGHTSAYCNNMLSILKAFRKIQPKEVNVDYEGVLEIIFNRFYITAKQLQRRHDGRETLIIADEYDVQDLLNSLLLLHFEDVRPEEWTPSYAGGSKRMDFLLKDAEIAIEVKMTRKGLKDKELGEQLIIDIANYKQHKECKCLYCFVFDPDGYIRNPRGLEKDLQTLDKELPVKVFIRPVF